MLRTRTPRSLPVAMRPLVVILLFVCAWTAVTLSSHASTPFGRAAQAAPAEFPRSAWAAIAHGKPAEAEALATARPGDPAAVAILAHLDVVAGRYDEAIAKLQPAAAKAPASDAALLLGLVQQRVGRSEAATQVLTGVFRQGAESSDAPALARAARAAQALGRPRDANALFRAASGVAPDPAIDTAWGLLFLEKYDVAEAMKSFRLALEKDARWAPAHAGAARVLSEEDPPAAAAAAQRALEIDPTLADAHLLLAELELDNTRPDMAKERIDKVLAINPRHLEARALVAAMAYVRGDRPAFDAEVRRVLDINPAYGEVYRVAGDFAARNYRFEEAVALSRQAIALDPAHWRALAELGMHLMRTGDEAEARQALDRAFRQDPYDKVTFNLLELLDKLDKFVVIDAGDIVLKLHPDEAAVMREYALPLAKDALRTLSARYDFTPKGPILIEIFPQHDDFAVRTLGLPGMIGALGACFGRVVAMDSPKARPPGTFSWEATLWHEMAHVITLQMSQQRVPRWLTEGISVYEEGRARPEWGRDMEVPFALALERDKTLKLKDLNSGFTRPDTIALAYFQSSLLVDHLVKTHGEPKLRELVRSYATGLEGNAAIETVVGTSLDQLQVSFDQAVDRRFGALRRALREASPGLGAAPAGADNIEALRTAAATNPNSYGAQLAFGQALAAAGDRAAFAPLEKAAALVPVATGEDSPHAIMARLAEKLGDTERAVKEYQLLLAQDHTAVEPARRLAALAQKSSTPEVATAAFSRVISLDPFDAEGHTALGRYALKKNDAALAIREFRAALAIGPADRASAHCDLGEAYLLGAKPADAKREALAALEIAPTFERAQELLLKAIQKTTPASAKAPAGQGRP
jgi:tetratricopeptide (TPR) repeat protein